MQVSRKPDKIRLGGSSLADSQLAGGIERIVQQRHCPVNVTAVNTVCGDCIMSLCCVSRLLLQLVACPPLTTTEYVMYFRFVDDVMFTHKGQARTTGMLKVTHQGSAPGRSPMSTVVLRVSECVDLYRARSLRTSNALSRKPTNTKTQNCDRTASALLKLGAGCGGASAHACI